MWESKGKLFSKTTLHALWCHLCMYCKALVVPCRLKKKGDENRRMGMEVVLITGE